MTATPMKVFLKMSQVKPRKHILSVGKKSASGSLGAPFSSGSNPLPKEARGERRHVIVRTGLIGIATNVLLSAVKLIIGFAASSLAFILDGINNLTDAFSSVITIIGIKLASKPADKKHPMGHGRVEYLSALIIGLIIMATGVFALRDAIVKIIHPAFGDYAPFDLWIMLAAIAVKLLLGIYTRQQGKRTDSDALKASGVDALFDALVTVTTLIAMGCDVLLHVTVDGWVSSFISLVVIKAGWDITRNVIDQVLGTRINPQLAKDIKHTIDAFPEVLGVHDLFLDSYGPDQMIGSVHIAVDHRMTADKIDVLSRNISGAIAAQYNIIITCGVYGVSPEDPQEQALFEKISNMVMAHENALSIHGFYWNRTDNIIQFDIVRSFDIKHPEQWLAAIQKELEEKIPGYTYKIHLDIDYAE